MTASSKTEIKDGAETTLPLAGRCVLVTGGARRLGAAGYRRSIRIAYAFGAMQGRPVQQKPEPTRGVLDNAMHAEEAASGLRVSVRDV